MDKWESERELADELKTLTEKVRKLQDEIRADALAARREPGLVLPLDDERRLRPIEGDPAPKKPEPDR